MGALLPVGLAFADSPGVGKPAVEPTLTEPRLAALGMIESGNDDSARGPAGEISRFQIQPFVWRRYSTSANFSDQATAAEVARLHWNFLAEYFRRQAGRTAADFDLYVLWNTPWGYYEARGFSRERLPAEIRDRAERFVNLVNREQRLKPAAVAAASPPGTPASVPPKPAEETGR